MTQCIYDYLGHSDISTEIFESTFENTNKQLRIGVEPNRPE